MAELIVITGGSYAGKTALVRALAARGHATLPEAAMEVIRELTDAVGLEAQIRWRAANQVEFQRRITVLQHARECEAHARSAGRVFCDRGALDGLAYCRLAGVPWPDDLETLVASAQYPHVFVLETLHGFEARRETGRSHSHADSLRVASILEDVYRPCAETLTRLPVGSVETRTGRVLRVLEDAAS